jgi:hypothetical protein
MRGVTGRRFRKRPTTSSARVLRHANALRGSGWACGNELSPPERRWPDFLYEVGEIAERGGDVRRRVVGVLDEFAEDP